MTTVALPALLGNHAAPAPAIADLVSPDTLRTPAALLRAQVNTLSTRLSEGLVWLEAGADLPRFQGGAGRLLVEGQRTNNMLNPRADGGNPTNGITGSLGSFLPTGWTQNSGSIANNLLADVLGTFTVQGVRCVRIRFYTNGAPLSGSSSPNISPSTSTAIAAANGQTWTGSIFLRVVSGTPATVQTRLIGRPSSGAGSVAGQTLFNARALNGDLERFASTFTFSDAAVAYVTYDVLLSHPANWSGDYTIDVGWPQLEQAAFASTPILPPAGSPQAGTRGADLVTASLAALGIGANGACTILWSGVIPQAAPAGADQMLFQLDGGSDATRIRLRNPAGGAAILAGRVTAGAAADAASLGNMTPGAALRLGLTHDGAGRVAAVMAGGAVQAVTGAPTTGLATLRLGANAAGGASMFGETLRFRATPGALSDAALLAAVAALPG